MGVYAEFEGDIMYCNSSQMAAQFVSDDDLLVNVSIC